MAIKNGINKEMIESDVFLFFDIELIIIKTNDISNNKSKGITQKTPLLQQNYPKMELCSQILLLKKIR